MPLVAAASTVIAAQEVDDVDPIRVAVVDWTGRREDDLLGGIAALREQVHLDFAPVWRIDADLVLVPNTEDTTWPGCWGLVLFGPNDKAADRYEVSGYRAITDDGHPLALVRVAPGDGGWTHRASHELLELLVDPDGVGAVYRDADRRFYARRVCDPCRATTYGYRRCGRLVSDFVYPSWFDSAASGRTGDRPRARFDHGSHVAAAFQTLAGESVSSVAVAAPPEPLLQEGVERSISHKGIWPP